MNNYNCDTNNLLSDPDPESDLNFTSVQVLKAYLDSFIFIPSSDNLSNNTGSSDELSAGVIAGIVISVAVLIVLLIISAVSIYLCRCSSKYKTSCR